MENNDTLNCSQCGTSIQADDKFCRECGAKIDVIPAPVEIAEEPVVAEAPVPAPRFCTKCGAQLVADAKFCISCGNPAASQSPGQQRAQFANPAASEATEGVGGTFGNIAGERINAGESQDYERYPHPYHKLGGWFAFVTYAQMVAVGLTAVMILSGLISMFHIMRNWGYMSLSQYLRYQGPWFTIQTLLYLVGYAIVCYYCIKFYIMIKNKDPEFFRFYELTMIAMCSLYVAIIVLTGFHAVQEPIKSIFSALIGFAIWSTYFRKSVRVRTYMGSDAYLRHSIFFKNTVSPEPADTKPYTGY